MRSTAVGTDLPTVIAGLDPAIHRLRLKCFLSMDARVISAFTRVFDALRPGMTSQRLNCRP